MADQSLDILINFIARTQGAEAAQQALEEVQHATKGASEAVEEHHHSFVHVEASGRAFHHLMHQITEQSPIMGLALRTALSPIGGALAGAGLALHYFKEEMKKVEEEAKAIAEEAAKPWGDMAKAISDTVDKVHEADVAYADFVVHLHDNTKKITEDLDKTISKMNAEAEAWKKLTELHEKGEPMPGIAEGEKMDVEAKQRLAKVEAAAVEKAKQAEADAQNAANLRESQANDFERKKRIEFLESQKGRFPGAEKFAQDKFIEAEEKAQKAQTEWEAIRRITPGMPHPTEHPAFLQMQRTREEADKAMHERDQIKNLEKTQADELAKLTAEQKAYDTELGHAKEALKAATEQAKALSDKLAALNQSIKIEQASQTIRESGVGSIVAAGAEALKALKEHHGRVQELDKAQQGALKALSTLLEGIHANNNTMLNAIEKGADNLEALAARTKMIEDRQAQIGRTYGG